jgi:hypothetical protein
VSSYSLAASTEVGHQSTIGGWTAIDGKTIWSTSVHGTTGLVQLSASKQFFGTVLPLENPVGKL